MSSKIQWTNLTKNPIKVSSGGNYCEKVSPGCKFCYAEGINKKPFLGGNGQPYVIRKAGRPKMTLNTEMLAKWATMRKPKKIFVGSMTDILGEWVSDEMIHILIRAMVMAPLQTFQLLTKRPDRLPAVIDNWNKRSFIAGSDGLPENIWLGTSAENQKYLDERLPWLIRAQAQVRFLSLEPLLGPIYLFDVDGPAARAMAEANPKTLLWPQDMIDWVIIGGESGSKARPMVLNWVRSILEQCQAVGIPAFVKQLGSVWAKENGAAHSKGGNPDEWPDDLRIRMMPGEAWPEKCLECRDYVEADLFQVNGGLCGHCAYEYGGIIGAPRGVSGETWYE